MGTYCHPLRRVLTLAGILTGALLLGRSVPAQTVTQTLMLDPGWNPIFLEVQPDANDMATVFGADDTPIGHYALVTLPDRLPEFDGVAMRDNQMVGRRISAVAYDFATGSSGYDAASPTMTFSGQFGPPHALAATLVLPPAHVSNPFYFYHRYHPDHGETASFTITRSLALQFTADDPERTRDTNPVGWGRDVVGGTCSETVTGFLKVTGANPTNRPDLPLVGSI